MRSSARNMVNFSRFSAPVQSCVAANYASADSKCCTILQNLKNSGQSIKTDCDELFRSGTFYDSNACGGVCK